MIGDNDKSSVANERRIGKFRIGSDLLRVASDDEIRSMFDGIMITRAEYLFSDDEVEYTGYHRSFGQVEHGALIPMYVMKFRLDNGIMKRTEMCRSDI